MCVGRTEARQRLDGLAQGDRQPLAVDAGVDIGLRQLGLEPDNLGGQVLDDEVAVVAAVWRAWYGGVRQRVDSFCAGGVLSAGLIGMGVTYLKHRRKLSSAAD